MPSRKEQITIGVLAFHGDVAEHVLATNDAAQKLRMTVSVREVRTKEHLAGIDGLIIPGGESPTLQKLCQRENMWVDMKKIKNIFGTCAGAIMLAKDIDNASEGQETLELMDIKIARNAYGRQTDSFQEKITTELGTIEAIFIRAPKIVNAGKNVRILAKRNDEIIGCEEKVNDRFYLAATFHPELTTTAFHEYFLQKIA